MENLLSIGKVAKLKDISIKSLRYYDEIGVLKPAFINADNNYRYYIKDQLFLLDAITMCIELGIPLKDFKNYVDTDGVNLIKLLSDGKLLADKKINEIHSCLNNLQNAINCLNTDTSILSEKITYERKIEERTILAISLEDSISFSDYNQKILKLFMLAQLLDITVSYPSGILYQYKEHSLEKSIFLHVENTNNNVESRIITLKGGNYLCKQHNAHEINSGINIFSEVCKYQRDFCIIETDILHETRYKNTNNLELQILI